MVARDKFKLSFKHFSDTFNMLLKNSLIVVETIAFLSCFDSIPESSTIFLGYVECILQRA